MEYISLDKLTEDSSNDCIIQVKVSRKWIHKDALSGKILGLSLIFVDRFHNRIHCWVDKKFMKMIDEILYEDNIYYIHNFTVEEYNSSQRCFQSEYQLILTDTATITKVDQRNITFPPNIYVFANLRNIDQLAQNDAALIDVVGMVQGIQMEQYVTNKNMESRSFVEFNITDHINTVTVRFWDDFGKSFYNALTQATTLPPVIIIVFAKLRRNKYTGVTTISNVEPTTFYINANCEKCHKIRQRFWEINGI